MTISKEDQDVMDVLAEARCQMLRGVLHGVAQTDSLNTRGQLRECPAVHRHWVDVVHQKRVWAQFLHIIANAFENRDRAQGAENTADAERITNGLA